MLSPSQDKSQHTALALQKKDNEDLVNTLMMKRDAEEKKATADTAKMGGEHKVEATDALKAGAEEAAADEKRQKEEGGLAGEVLGGKLGKALGTGSPTKLKAQQAKAEKATKDRETAKELTEQLKAATASK